MIAKRTPQTDRENRDAAMKAMYELGASTTEVGLEFNLDPSQVSRRLRAIGAAMRPFKSPRRSNITYGGAHIRVRSDRGPASKYLCSCGAPAVQWSYDHSDPNERNSTLGPYSLDPSHYMPMCVSCHKVMDLRALGILPAAEQPRTVRPTFEERYWSKVDRRADDECWPWLGAVTNGSGVIQRGRRSEGVASARRVAFELAFGAIPDGCFVTATCETRTCQNPDHLIATMRRRVA